MSTITPAALVAELAAATPTLSDRQQQLAISVYRLLVYGEPVGRDRLANHAGLSPEHVTEMLAALPGVHLDDRDRVIGFWGLTIRPMAHRLVIDNRALYAWCAWDTLFLPELIGKPAQVRSTCPTTGTPISMMVRGQEISDVSPGRTALSLLHRDRPFAADAIATFCHYVHFFADRPAAERWATEHAGTFVISLADGAEIARLANAARFPTLLQRPRSSPRD